MDDSASAPDVSAPAPAPVSRAGALLLVMALAVPFLFLGLGDRSLWTPDEGRYAEIAREMLRSGDWITPRLNGTLYFEKPPLVYWATAFSFRLFGTTEWAARLPPVGFSLIGLLAVFLLGARTGPRGGLLAGLVLVTSPLYFVLSRVLVLDMALCGFLALAIALYERATAPTRRDLLALSAVSLGLAVLAKGPVAVVLFLFVLLPSQILERERRLRPADLAMCILVTLVVTVPWFVLISRAQPTFAHFFFIHEHLERYATDSHKREGSALYFLPVFLLGFFPWLGFLGTRAPARLRVIVPAWAILPFVFFSLSKSKLPPYVLPAWPAMALLVSAALEGGGPWLRRRTLVVGLLGAALAGALRVVSLDRDPYLLAMVAPLAVVLTTHAAVLLGLAAVWRAPSGHVSFWVTCLATAGFLLSIDRLSLGYEPVRDVRPLVRSIREHRMGTEPVMMYGVLEVANPLPFYLGERVIVGGHHFGELTMGKELRRPEDAGYFLEPVEAENRIRPSSPRILVVIEEKAYPYLESLPYLRVIKLAQHGRLVLFTNRGC